MEIGIPINVVLYENNIRVGTVKYAMIQPLQASTAVVDPNGNQKWILPISNIIQMHFLRNASEILQEVRSWTSDGVYDRDRSKVPQQSTLPIDTLETTLFPKLEMLLKQAAVRAPLAPPVAEASIATSDYADAVTTRISFPVDVNSKNDDDDGWNEMEMKLPAKRSSVPQRRHQQQPKHHRHIIINNIH
jgi:hypothetical protein